MADNQRLFLTLPQAVAAICADFKQYDPQLMLFSEILRLLSNGKLHLQRESDRNGAWVNTGTHHNMHWIEGPDLVAYMCNALNKTPLDLNQVVAICSRVFQTRVEAGFCPESNTRGLFIETGMAYFTCRQCGHCCHTLDYHNEVTAKDIKRWQAKDRHDILEWVGHFKAGEQIIYQIWIPPGTCQLATRCPFLKKHPSQNRWSCRIHDDKPTICRDYPVSRKHALMTGCRGFEK